MLRKILVTLVVATMVAGYAQAQFKIGPRVGFNLTNFSQKYANGNKPSGDLKPKFKPGFQISIVGEYSFVESFAIQTEVLYAQQGAKFETELAGFKFKNTVNLNYIQIPVNAQYKLDLGLAKLFLQAGPYIGYGFGGRIKVADDKIKAALDLFDKDWDKIEMGSDKEKNNYKAFDFGLGFGAGVEFLGSIQVGVGYNMGLTNIGFRYLNDTESYIKNNSLTFSLTYLFKI